MGSAPPFWRKPNFLYYWLPPVLWGLAVLSLSGDVGSDTNTRHLLQWLLSWFVALEPAQIDLINFYPPENRPRPGLRVYVFSLVPGFSGHADYGPWRACLWSLGFCLLYSSTDEGRQWFYASRGASIYDVILDMSGASLAALITGAVWTPGSKTAAISGIAEGQTIGPE